MGVFSRATANDRSSIRALMVSTRAFPDAGGVETHIHEVAPRLVRMGVSVSVATTDPRGRFPADEWIDGVHIRRFPGWPDTRDYTLAPQIYRTIKRERWDLVHCQGIHTLIPPLAMLAAWRARIPYVVTLHSGGHSSRVRNALRIAQWWALRPLLTQAARLIAVSMFEADLFSRQLRLPMERFAVIPNGSDLPPPTSELPARRRERLILSIGRLERYKGHHRVIAALPAVLRAYPDARLEIIGGGPYEPQLRQLAQRLGVVERVEIRELPANDRAGMANLLARAGLLVLLSEYESQSITVMEALAAGCPVVATHTTALRPLARDGWIQAVPLRCSANEIAAAIIGQLNDHILPGTLPVPRWDECASDLHGVYRQIVSSAPRGEARATSARGLYQVL
ncbi:MAG TPA: glycosyltransferase family 4 protein [Candidatus Dormibacteraeota bacterium]|nr:glycosyltransferase family 4 protein [Candidatus Dormibacteraeota bacterium]